MYDTSIIKLQRITFFQPFIQNWHIFKVKNMFASNVCLILTY